MTSLILPAPAKINLFLCITGRRADGFHDLQTLFQILDYGDQLKLTGTDSGEITLRANIPEVATDDNLVYRAAHLLRQSTGSESGADIVLDKRLPHGAGLGGGSSDAATTLVGLNHLWELNLTTDELAELGLQLGSDVPVFVRGFSGIGEGRGEILTAAELAERWYLILYPNIAVSTAQIFSHSQLTRNSPQRKIPALLKGGAGNDCLAVVEKLYPEVAEARIWLSQFGDAHLSGTGSSLFCAFDERETAQQALNTLPKKWRGFIAKGRNRSPLLDAFKVDP